MEKTLEVLNRLEAAGLMGRYAIGGAVAAAYYVEPTVTEGVLSKGAFMRVLVRFSLLDKWDQFILRHFDGQEPSFPIP
ncbi:MAG: hypothetical protein NTV46_20310 [Verrucomicrobia bacterium]|nr:hypothetical protein [Verrucomicrobiota bacterium]